MDNSVDKKKSIKWELFRFIVCGVAATIADYLVCQLFILLFGFTDNQYLIIAISTLMGFVAGTIVNYLISTFWVYQNVDENIQTKSAKFITLFVLLSLAAAVLSIGIMLLSNVITTSIWGESGNIVDISLIDLIKEFGFGFLGQFPFWLYFVCFCIRTLIGLTFNYFTRKFILYKKPKE